MNQIFLNRYPYTDFHELNLDWLLTTYQSIVDNVNELIAYVNSHKIEYSEAIARLTAVETEIDTFEQQIEAEFARLKAEQQVTIDNAINRMDNTIDTKLLQFQNELNQRLTEFTNDFLNLQAQVMSELNRLKADINSMIIELRNSQQANNQLIMAYVENRLEQFINDFPSLIDTPVYNPVKGVTTTLQRAIDDLYDFARFYGLTASQYDSLQITASEYDAKGLTALEYDQHGYLLLGYPDENLYMLNPFNGTYQLIKSVVSDLAYLHMNILTAAEYDAKEFTALEYDEKEITAFNYDWNGKDLLIA